MAKVLGIDPGNEYTGWILFDTRAWLPLKFGRDCNATVMARISDCQPDVTVIEMFASMGMLVGQEVFDACAWVGRFEQRNLDANRHTAHRLLRRDVKLHLCGTARAKDKNIRQALLDRFPATGGGKVPQLGTKANPGPLYGVSRDVWSALALAVTWWDTEQEKAK